MVPTLSHEKRLWKQKKSDSDAAIDVIVLDAEGVFDRSLEFELGEEIDIARIAMRDKD